MSTITTSGSLTLAECVEQARAAGYGGISQLTGAAPLPADFPDAHYEIVDHGEFGYHELPPSTNPFRNEPTRSGLDTTAPAPPLGGVIDVWAVRHPARKAGDEPWIREDEPEHTRWHAGGPTSSSCQKTRAEAIEHALGSLAFLVVFWVEKLRWHRQGDRHDRGDRVARVGGTHYVLGNGTGPFRGMAGRPVGVRFHDGTEVVCTDLWFQGPIPAELRPLLPDNAELFTPEPAR